MLRGFGSPKPPLTIATATGVLAGLSAAAAASAASMASTPGQMGPLLSAVSLDLQRSWGVMGSSEHGSVSSPLVRSSATAGW
jgi:hypothetical protein